MAEKVGPGEHNDMIIVLILLGLLHMHLPIMFSKQCKQNSILYSLCHHSGWPAISGGTVREGKEKKGLS